MKKQLLVHKYEDANTNWYAQLVLGYAHGANGICFWRAEGMVTMNLTI